MSHITAYGELLIDLIGRREEDTLTKRPGGAPANMAAGCALLGHDVDLITCVGEDAFGDFLIEAMDDAGVNTDGIQRTTKRTTLAVSTLDEDGVPSFMFYRDANADTEITDDAIDQERLAATEHFHFGSLSLTHDPVRSTLLTVLEDLEAQVSFDPNLREDLLDEELIAEITAVLDHVDMLLCAEDELAVLADANGIEARTRQLMDAHGIDEVVVTRGGAGTTIYTATDVVTVPAQEADVVDTTGAGDAFTAGYVTARLEGKDPTTAGERGSRTAAHCVAERGAIAALPTRDELEERS